MDADTSAVNRKLSKAYGLFVNNHVCTFMNLYVFSMSTEIPPAVTNSQNDDMCDEVYRGCFLEEFKEAKEVTNIIANLSNIYKDQIAVERALERFQCKYFGLRNGLQLLYH